MKKYINYIKRDRLILRLFLLSLTLIALTLIYILINFSKLPPLLPLFNQLPWGEKRLSDTLSIFIPIINVSIVLIFNVILSSLCYSRYPLISRMLAVTTFIISLLNFLFILRTIQLIT